MNISTAIHYPAPPHLQTAYAELGFRRDDFPIAETMRDQVLSLPLWPQMAPEEVNLVTSTIKEAAHA